ncbi:MAG: thiamine pyrophosphate-binding protein [Alphaproteobacteria bacterium]|nr:thiamine pyrophosphate-binding protein [Alphaproteobacteria bacterium]
MATNQLTGGEAAVRMLQLHGVKHVFGLCGDTSLPFYDALARLDHGMTHILTRDERHAAYMADCYARVTGKVGVCEGPSGGGATYILPGVVEANESSIPILAITTDISVSARGKFTLTELDQEALFRPLTKWNKVIDRAAELPSTFRAAFRAMTAGRAGSAHIGLPFDVQRDPVDEADVRGDPTLGSFPSRRIGPDPRDIARAADALAAAKEPIFVCGGAPVIAGAEAEMIAIAELLEAPVATTISGQGTIPDDHPLAVGVVGSNGGVIQTREMVLGADLVCFVGCRAGSVTTERWRHPKPGAARIVQIDADPNVLGATYDADVAVLGDAKLALAALLAELKARVKAPPKRQRGRAAVAAAKQAKFAAFDELARSADRPIKPERVVAELNQVLPDDAVIVADPGTPCPYFSAFYRCNRTGRHFISNRAHGALGYSIAGAMGAYYGRPSSKIVSVMGDGSFGFACGEFETVVRLGLPITFVVFSNAVYGWIKAGQKTGYQGRYFSVDFSRTDHARVAEAFGLKAWRVEDPAQLKPTLKKAVEAGGPTLVDVIAQPLNEARAPVSEWVA